ncbi:MAG: tetratricopeptide repeat protein [Anaerolineae bacterium]|nr:tetratricopeptide repeat protein [Anaerolineae bacterium]
MFTLHFFGGFNAAYSGSPLTGFATDKARALLVYLALESDRPHRRESLASLFWPEQPEERARQSLRQALSNLRQVLAEQTATPFLNVTNADVQMSTQAEVWTDVQAFRVLLRESREHTHACPENCLSCLRRQQQIANLYTGEFLAGFGLPDSQPFEEWLLLTRENLQIEAVQVLASLAEYEERRGQFSAARQYALRQVRFEPWREEAHAQVMRLLAYEGQRSAALSQYAVCCRVLQAELGLEPTRSTRLLAEQIQSSNLLAPRLPPLPPNPPASFVGREKERAELAEMLANPSCRLLTVLGPGGAGKTRLALQVALDHAGLYHDGIHFVHLAAVSDRAAALLMLAEKLGLQAAPGADLRKLICENLNQRQMLIVLDNFEQLASESEAWSEFFRCASGIKWMVTSREKLCLREEWVYPLAGLPLTNSPRPVAPPNEQNQPAAALALFAERAIQADRHFELTPERTPAVLDICRMVEGLPLGVELAAATVAEKIVEEIAADLRKNFDSLAPSIRNLPGRHASLRAVFEHSWDLLSPEERARLADLSVFVGGFSAEAALTVAEISSLQLAELAAKSLLRRDSDGRYALHETIRQFAAEKLEHVEAARHRHGVYYARLASCFDGALTASALDMLQTERANLRAAWEGSVAGDVGLTADLLPGLSLLYTLRGPLSEGEELFRAANCQVALPSDLKDAIALELARIYNAQTRHDEAIALARSVSGSARALLIEGQAFNAKGEGEVAQPVLEKSLALARQTGDKRIEADCLRELGNIANRLCDYALAVKLYRQSLVLARKLGDLRGESATLNNFGTVEWELGDLTAAQAHYEQALGLYRELGNRPGEAKALNNLSNVLADRGDLAGSLVYSRQSLEIHREMGNPRGQCSALNNLGATYFCLKDYDAARTSYLQALALYRQSENSQAEGETLGNLSLLDCVQGRLAEGRENARAAIDLAEAAGDKTSLANAFYYLGRIELADNNFDAADRALTRALDLRHDFVPHPGRIAEIRAELALSAFKQGDTSLARERIAPVVEALELLDGANEPERVRNLVEMIKVES